MKRIVHIITGLNNGGAEMMLYKLLQNSDRHNHEFSVISMLDKGVMGERIEKLGIPVYCLNLNKSKNLPAALIITKRLCRDADTIQTWMYHANLWAFLVNLFLRKRIVWGIRHGPLDPSVDKLSTIRIAKLCGKLSSHVAKIVYCAENAREFHEENYKYNNKNGVVIPNGFELDKYKKNKNAGMLFRNSLGIDQDKTLIAFVGRYHAVKGYENFCKALKIVNETQKDRYIVLFAGTGATDDNTELNRLILENDLKCSTICLGRRDDIPALLSAADLFVSSSYLEGFSNAIGEAMACEVPCVVTDVGDSAYLINDTGIVVESNEPAILAKGILQMLNKTKEERSILGEKARLRVMEYFDINSIVKEYEKLYF
jgi:glycosyltransferase involved in cell wall biosynthesis